MKPDGVRAGHHGAAPRRWQPWRDPRRARGPGHAVDRDVRLAGSRRRGWLPDMARMDKLGAFALTEPEHGSDSVALETSARPDGGEWVLNGSKRWIGLGTVADLIVVWARSTQDGQVGAFVVEKGAPGYQARVIEGKVSRARCGRPTSRWTTCGCRPRTGCPGRGRSRTPAGSWPPPEHLRLGGARPRHRRLRHRLALRAGAAAVRRAASQLPDHPAAAGGDAGGPERDAALLRADRAPG